MMAALTAMPPATSQQAKPSPTVEPEIDNFTPRGLRGGLLTSRRHLDRLVREFAASVPPGAMMLDAGAGDSPYRRYFKHAVYEATDICKRDAHQYAHVNYICDLTAVPVEADRYDAILCTQVLEHVPRPQEVIRELHRILKPGGRLWLSTPLYFQEHEIPYDFYRYTQYGLRHLMDAAGFEVVELDWVTGYLGTLAHQLNIARRALPWRPRDFGGGLAGFLTAAISLLCRPVWLLFAVLFSRADLRTRYTRAGHCMDYYVLARKPA